MESSFPVQAILARLLAAKNASSVTQRECNFLEIVGWLSQKWSDSWEYLGSVDSMLMSVSDSIRISLSSSSLDDIIWFNTSMTCLGTDARVDGFC